MHPLRNRRRVVLGGIAGGIGAWISAAAPGMAAIATLPQPPSFAVARAGLALQFPRDHGSHPDFRIEWWYVTGWLRDTDGKELGIQITFFRARPALPAGNPSRFAPDHILIAHAAIADPAFGRLRHAQRAARAGFELAGAATDDTHVWIDDWEFARRGERFHAHIAAPELAMQLELTPTQGPLLQGHGGYSRKGPQPASASYYYSLPHLAVSGTLRSGNQQRTVSGTAWLDHEWSSSYLDAQAAGWDWIGINLADGGALMAFRMRDKRGGVWWAGGSHRNRSGSTRVMAPADIAFTPLRRWQSPHTGTAYPVAFRIRASDLEFTVEPLLDDQENDTRATTGAVYWEGAVRAMQDGQEIGKGYLELTGYQQPLAL